MTLDPTTSLKVIEEEQPKAKFQEVSAPAPAVVWNEQSDSAETRNRAYILVCLPLCFCIIYWVVRLARLEGWL